MPFRLYMLCMSLATGLAWLAWGIVIWNINPEDAGLGGLLLFYSTIGLGLIGIFSLFGLAYRVFFSRKHGVMSRLVRTSFRHAIFLSLTVVGTLILAAADYLRWWIVAVIVISVSACEYVFLLREEAKRI